MVNLFQVRGAAPLCNAISANPGSPDWESENGMLYLLGREPQTYFKDYKNTAQLNAFLKTQELEGADRGEISKAAAFVLADRLVDKGLMEKVAADVAQRIDQNGREPFDKVRVVAPYPADPNEVFNQFAPAMAAEISVRLQAALDEALIARGLEARPVVADLEAQGGMENPFSILSRRRGGIRPSRKKARRRKFICSAW